MNSNKVMRVVVDVALTAMIAFEMLIQFTGEFLHEVIGFAFFATVVVHMALSAVWVKKTARNARQGKLTARRTALAVMGCLLAATVVLLAVSSVAISGILASAGFAWPFGSYALWADVHAYSAYAFCALVVVHLAMHWAFLASAFKVPYDPSRRRAIATSVNAAAALGVVALGVVVANKSLPQNLGFAAGQDVATGVGEDSSGASASADGMTGESSGNTVKPSGNEGRSGKHGFKGGSFGHGFSNGGGSDGAERSDGSNGFSSGSDGAKGTGGTSGGSNGSGGVSDGSSSDGAGNGTSGSGICTLCRKQCPLSAPKCNKPYEAGLL